MYKKLITLLIIGVAISSTYAEFCCTGTNCDGRTRCRVLGDAPKKMAKAAPIKEVGKGSAKPLPKPVLKKAADVKVKPVGGKGSLPPMPKPVKKAPVKKVGGKGSLPPKKAPKRKHHGKRRHHTKRRHHGKRKGGFFHKMAHHFHHFHKFIKHHFKRMSKRFRKAHNKLKAKLAAAKSKAKKGSKKAKAEVKKVKKELKKDAKKAAKAAPKKDAKKAAKAAPKKDAKRMLKTKVQWQAAILKAKNHYANDKHQAKIEMTKLKDQARKEFPKDFRRLDKHVKAWKNNAVESLKCKGKKGKKNCDDKNNNKGHDRR